MSWFLSPMSANKRKYQKVYSSNVTSRVVSRACALRTSGPKKGKLRRGCYFRGKHAYCDAVVADRLKCSSPAVKAVAKRLAKRERDVRPTPVKRKRSRKSPKRLTAGKATRKKSLQYRKGRGWSVRGLKR